VISIICVWGWGQEKYQKYIIVHKKLYVRYCDFTEGILEPCFLILQHRPIDGCPIPIPSKLF